MTSIDLVINEVPSPRLWVRAVFVPALGFAMSQPSREPPVAPSSPFLKIDSEKPCQMGQRGLYVFVLRVYKRWPQKGICLGLFNETLVCVCAGGAGGDA